MTRLLAITSLITAAIFVLAIAILHFLPTGVNPIVSGISFYALSRYGFLLNLAVFSVSVSGIALSLALLPVKPSTSGRIGLLLLIAWGLTGFLVGLFPVDAPGATPTLPGRIHNLAGMNFLLLAAALLLIELSRSTGRHSGQTRAITFWLAWALLVAAVLLFVFNGPLYSMQMGGLFQRLYWLVAVLWLASKSLQLLKWDSAHSTSERIQAYLM